MGDAPLVGHAHLLLEDRVKHHGGAPRILEPLDGVKAIAEW